MPFETSDSKSEAIKEFKRKLSKLETEHGRLAGLSLHPQPTDVFLVTPPKCGTTWVCQILHSLRTRGNMDFDEINIEIPCLEMAYDSGLTNIDVPQTAPPRVFKTHSWYRDCPKGDGVKYIYVVRNPLKAGPSFYNFMANWFFDPSDIGLDEFLEEFFLARGAPETIMQNASHWHNMTSWYPYRTDPNMLWLHYEDLVEDLPAAVALIADFVGVGSGDVELQNLVCEQSSLEFMQQHASKYDEHHLKEARNVACGLDARAGMGVEGNYTGKIRAAGSEGRKKMSQKTVEAIAKKWEKVVVPVMGYKSYEEMRLAINKELGRPFSCAS